MTNPNFSISGHFSGMLLCKIKMHLFKTESLNIKMYQTHWNIATCLDFQWLLLLSNSQSYNIVKQLNYNGHTKWDGVSPPHQGLLHPWKGVNYLILFVNLWIVAEYNLSFLSNSFFIFSSNSIFFSASSSASEDVLSLVLIHSLSSLMILMSSLSLSMSKQCVFKVSFNSSFSLL